MLSIKPRASCIQANALPKSYASNLYCFTISINKLHCFGFFSFYSLWLEDPICKISDQILGQHQHIQELPYHPIHDGTQQQIKLSSDFIISAHVLASLSTSQNSLIMGQDNLATFRIYVLIGFALKFTILSLGQFLLE